MSRLALVGVIFASFATSSQLNEPERMNLGKPLTVCAVLQDLAKYRGKLLEIRGEWNGFLNGSCPPLKTGYYTWPNTIVVEHTKSVFVDVPWKGLDWSLYGWILKGVQADFARLPAETQRQAVIMATVVGELDSRDPPLALTPLDQPFGYGEQGIYPARIILYTVEDIAITLNGRAINVLPPSGR